MSPARWLLFGPGDAPRLTVPSAPGARNQRDRAQGGCRLKMCVGSRRARRRSTLRSTSTLTSLVEVDGDVEVDTLVDLDLAPSIYVGKPVMDRQVFTRSRGSGAGCCASGPRGP